MEKRTIDRIWNNVEGFEYERKSLQQVFLEIVLCCDNQGIYAEYYRERRILTRIVLKVEKQLNTLFKRKGEIKWINK